jgi:uncharacterized protein (DUF1778 family)
VIPDDPAVGHPASPREPTTAPGGASCRVRRSYGPSYAAQNPSGPRARAHADRPGGGCQEATGAGGEADDQPPAFAERKPRRRNRNSTQRAHKLTIRLSDSERAEIAAAARLHTLTLAGFLATAGLSAARGRVAVRPDRQLAAAVDELVALRTSISRVGNNLNQIAHVHNAVGRPVPRRLDHALRALLDVLARIDDAADVLVSRRS